MLKQFYVIAIVMLALLVVPFQSNAAEYGTTIDLSTPITITIDSYWTNGQKARDHVTMKLFSVWNVGEEEDVMVGLDFEYRGTYYEVGDITFYSMRNDMMPLRVISAPNEDHRGWSTVLVDLTDASSDSNGNLKLMMKDKTDIGLKYSIYYIPSEFVEKHVNRVVAKMIISQP